MNFCRARIWKAVNPHRRAPWTDQRSARAGGAPDLRSGFTLIELLVVLAIIGILAAVALPSIKGMQKSNVLVSATRQLIDDLARARATAIRERTTVHVIFVPPSVVNITPSVTQDRGGLLDRKQWTNLVSGAYTRYAIFAERTVGDQPGQPRPRYIGEWQQLPEGVTIAGWEFDDDAAKWGNNINPNVRPLKFDLFPFPTVSGANHRVPHVAFNSEGGLIRFNSSDDPEEVINLARASVLVVRNPATRQLVDFDVRESPPNNSLLNYNRVRIDALTGRARVERPEVQ